MHAFSRVRVRVRVMIVVLTQQFTHLQLMQLFLTVAPLILILFHATPWNLKDTWISGKIEFDIDSDILYYYNA